MCVERWGQATLFSTLHRYLPTKFSMWDKMCGVLFQKNNFYSKNESLRGHFGGLPIRHLAVPKASNDIPHRRKELSGLGLRRDREHPLRSRELNHPFRSSGRRFPRRGTALWRDPLCRPGAHSKLAKTVQNGSKSAEAVPSTVHGPTQRKPYGLLSLLESICE